MARLEAERPSPADQPSSQQQQQQQQGLPTASASSSDRSIHSSPTGGSQTDAAETQPAGDAAAASSSAVRLSPWLLVQRSSQMTTMPHSMVNPLRARQLMCVCCPAIHRQTALLRPPRLRRRCYSFKPRYRLSLSPRLSRLMLAFP